MPSKRDMSLCPKVVITSKPKREAWAYEEIWDTLFEIDHEVRVVKTMFKGVYLGYLKGSSLEIFNSFTRYTHAFVSTVIPSLVCVNETSLRTKISSFISCIDEIYNLDGIYIKLRGQSKVLEKYLIKNLKILESPKKLRKILVIQGINDIIILSLGEFRSCGPRCHVLKPDEVILSCKELLD